MAAISDQDKVKKAKRVKSNNARCTFCRRCYNSGLCLMPWPGFPVAKSRAAVDNSKDSRNDS